MSEEKDVHASGNNIATIPEPDDRINITRKKQVFITYTDHKAKFKKKQSCRQIKAEINKVNKTIL